MAEGKITTADTKGGGDPAGLFKDIEHRYPELTGGFHANIVTVVFGKPVSQLLQSFRERGEASLLILSASIWVGDSNAGIDPSLVNIQCSNSYEKS